MFKLRARHTTRRQVKGHVTIWTPAGDGRACRSRAVLRQDLLAVGLLVVLLVALPAVLWIALLVALLAVVPLALHERRATLPRRLGWLTLSLARPLSV